MPLPPFSNVCLLADCVLRCRFQCFEFRNERHQQADDTGCNGENDQKLKRLASVFIYELIYIVRFCVFQFFLLSHKRLNHRIYKKYDHRNQSKDNDRDKYHGLRLCVALFYTVYL